MKPPFRSAVLAACAVGAFAGGNVLHVMAEAEAVAAKLRAEPPASATVEQLDGK